MKRLLEAALVALVGGSLIVPLLGINASAFGPGSPPLLIAASVGVYMSCGLVFIALADLALLHMEGSENAFQRNK